MNRVTGEVRIGQDEKPTPAEEWVELVPVPEADDRNDADEFVKEEGIASESTVVAALGSEHWYLNLASALREISPSLSSKWKRRRSNRVVARVESWRSVNGLGEAIIYEPGEERARPRIPASSQTPSLRAALLELVGTLPTEELLELRLPAGKLARALRPDLFAD